MNRLTQGPLGTATYGATQADAVASTSGGYTATYDTASDMTCRAVNTSQTCTGTPTGQTMAYDALCRLLSWQNAASSPTGYDYNGVVTVRTQKSATSKYSENVYTKQNYII
jgi:hypothetical protein